MPVSVGPFSASLALVLLPIAVGVVLGRAFQRIDNRSIAICAVYLFLPVYLFQFLAAPPSGGKELGLVFFFLFFHTAALWILGASTLRMLGLPRRTHSLILLTVLISHPYLFPSGLVRLFIGSLDTDAVLTAFRIFDIALLLFVTVGCYLASPKSSVPERLFDMVRLPITPLAFLGFLLGLLEANLSPAILSALGPLSQAAVPLTFLLLGILIGREFYLFDLPSLTPTLLAVMIATVFRLVISPVLALVLTKLMSLILPMPIEASLGRLLLLHTAMPTSVLAVVLVAYFGQPSDKRYIVLCVMATAILSCATIPLILLFAGS